MAVSLCGQRDGDDASAEQWVLRLSGDDPGAAFFAEEKAGASAFPGGLCSGGVYAGQRRAESGAPRG